MVRCTFEKCNATHPGQRTAALAAGWCGVMVEGPVGVKYRLFCPSHDVSQICMDVEDVLIQLRHAGDRTRRKK